MVGGRALFFGEKKLNEDRMLGNTGDLLEGVNEVADVPSGRNGKEVTRLKDYIV